MDTRGALPSDHHRPAIVDSERAVRRVDAEQLPIRPAESEGVSAEPVAEIDRGFPNGGQAHRRHVAAGRGVRRQAFELVAPGGDGGREVDGCGAG